MYLCMVAEDGQTGLYSINIVKDAFNRSLETTISVVGGIIILGGAIIIMIRKKRKAHKEYIEG